MPSPVTSHLAKYPCKAPGELFIHQPCLYMWPWHCVVVKKHYGDRLPTALPGPLQPTLAPDSLQWKFSIRQRCVSIKVTMVIYTLGDRHWRFGSALSDGGGWIPIRGLTFPGHSSNSILSWGQESRAPSLFPWGLEESYEQKVKARGRLKWRRVALIILVWCCLKRLL